MHVPRRLVVLLATGLFAVAPAAPALGQSAGDEQYSDPLGPSGQTTEATPKPEMPPLSDDPAGSNSGSGSAAPAPAPSSSAPSAVPADPAAAPATAAARAELPATGAEPGLVGALGAAFVLLGIGLRLRIADAPV